ncbi:MAG TPA: adenylyl-sulfate kinase, partial [Flavobacteriaceae bacterium]|nr:adenylyl-sulfate kinase [Flavobacteriaceae bacterium]
MNNNTPHQDYNIDRADRNKANGHNSVLIWFTGLSGSGKSTLANLVEVELHKKGTKTYVLDGDNIRRGINSDLDFSPEGRSENLRRIAETAKLFIDAGVVVLAAFISPLKKDREKIAKIVGEENFIEIYVNASVEECEARDVKGLYKKARNGEIPNFTGISAPYEPPENADVVVNSGKESVEESVDIIMLKIE